MQVVKVELEGIITSFRYPHFLIGKQPSYRMPPPATIYGHICSAVGDWIDPQAIQFAYYFDYAGQGYDLEHVHIATIGSGKFDRKIGFHKNIEAKIDVVLREVLFAPRLVLYIRSEKYLKELHKAFLSPTYAVSIGRSQDLASYKNVELIELKQTTSGYYEKTLLPWSYRPKTAAGISVLMPKFVNPKNRLEVSWDRYICLEQRVFYPAPSVSLSGPTIMLRASDDKPVYIDPKTPAIKGMQRIISFLSFGD